MFLEARGYSVVPVYSGNDGLSLLRKSPNSYDIVLLDEQMPGKDGLTVLSEIKQFLPDLPVVMVTKSEEEDLMERAIGKKIDGYLTKPVNPSQILMVCKRLLQSQEILSEEAKNAFVKNYSEIKNFLQNQDEVSHKDWVRIYQQLVRRELDTENVEDENIRQTHNTQKVEIGLNFSEFVMANYPLWIKKDGEPVEKPTLSNEILQKYVIPEINKTQKFALIVLDSIQLSQFVMIQRFLRKSFQNSGTYFYFSTLPTTAPHTLTSLFTGLLPTEFAEEKPELWDSFSGGANAHEKVAEFGFKRLGSEKKPLFFNMLKDNLKAEEILAIINKKCEDGSSFPLIFSDFLDLFQSNKQSKFVKELISSPKVFRDMTSAWFEKSELHKLLQELSKQNYTIALTPSSGNILCTTAAEFYGSADGYCNMRFRSGESIDVDRRIGFHVLEPKNYGLPIKSENTQINILNGTYYFAPHQNYKRADKTKRKLEPKYPASYFEKGGISLEEMIVPLTIMRPLTNEPDGELL
jgi:CheY-like chemotaxis protein